MLCCPKGFVNSSGSGGAMDGAILSLFFRRFFWFCSSLTESNEATSEAKEPMMMPYLQQSLGG